MNVNCITTINVVPQQFFSFEEIVKNGNFDDYYDHLEDDSRCRNAIFAPVASTVEEELVLYWEGDQQFIPGAKDIYTYFAEKGYEVIEKAHPSLLINAMKELTEEKLTEMGIPDYVDIVLPTSVDSLLRNQDDDLCFLEAHRHDGFRRLRLLNFHDEWNKDLAFLLRKIIKKNP